MQEISVQPESYQDYKQTKADIRQQRTDREALVKRIAQLEEQTETQREKATFCEKCLAEMEMQKAEVVMAR